MGCKFNRFILILSLLNLTIACGPVHNSAGNSNGSTLGIESAEIFEKTLYPILETNCATCHDGGISTAPEFATNDANVSQNTLLNFGLVNLNDPGASRVISEIASGHNGIPTDISSEIELAINDWLSQMSESEVN